MNFTSTLSHSEEYQSFRASVPLKKLAVDSDPNKVWKVYDAGPKTVKCPLICLAPVSGTADIFYKQILYLTSRGCRVLSVEGPVYWCVKDWCEGFRRVLDNLDIERVHIFGASLGGFLAQKFAEYTIQYPRVASLILCNSFLDTSIFNFNESAAMFWILPGPVLKKLVIGNIRSEPLNDINMLAVEFIMEKLENLSQQELASRLTLNCTNCSVDVSKLQKLKTTIIDVFDESALSSQARKNLESKYSQAKLAHLKTGGNFPYLSRPDEVNIHLYVHIREFSSSKYSAQNKAAGDIQKQISESEGTCDETQSQDTCDAELPPDTEVATEAS